MKIKYIIFLITLLASSLNCRAQLPSWWAINTGGAVMTINIEVIDEYTLDGQPIPNGCTIGAFVDTLGASDPVCIGNILFQGSYVALDVNQPPASAVGNIYFLLWDIDNSCTVYDVNTTIPMFNYQYNASMNFNMLSLIAKQSVLAYSKIEFCPDEPNPSPIGVHPHDAIFGGDPSIDANTGEIDLYGSNSGVILVTITSGGCLQNIEHQINILTELTCHKDVKVFSPESSIAEYQTHYINCEGDIEILTRTGQVVKSAQGPYYWDGTDNNGQLLPADEYYINCVGQAPEAISLIR